MQRKILEEGEGTDQVENIGGGTRQMKRPDGGRESVEWDEDSPTRTREV